MLESATPVSKFSIAKLCFRVWKSQPPMRISASFYAHAYKNGIFYTYALPAPKGTLFRT